MRSATITRWLTLYLRLALVAGLALGTLPGGTPAQAAPVAYAPAAPAASITVNTLVDEYGAGTDCSLREAIQAANTNSAFGGCPAGTAADTLTLSACCTYVLDRTGAGEDLNSTGDLDILAPITLQGEFGEVRTISQTVSDRVFHISATASADVRLNDLIIAGGVLTSGVGGGLYHSSGRLVLNESILMGNQATAGEGGGLYNASVLTMTFSAIISNTSSTGAGGLSNTGVLSITNSAIVSNTAPAAGGLRHATSTAHLVNVTVSGNRATAGSAGGLHNASGTLNLYNVTVYSNSASVSGGGVFNTGSFNFRASIIAGNSAPTVSPDCAGTLTSADYNLVQSTGGALAGTLTHVISGTSPLLSPLALNSNFDNASLNHLPNAGSPVIDAGPPGGCTNAVAAALDHDQRGLFRPADGNGDGSSVCDLGSVEFRPGQWELFVADPPYEDAGSLLLTAQRNAGGDGIITATLIFTSGTALAGSDFVGTPITLTAPDGALPQFSLAIPLLDDNLVEGTETFSVGLVNPGGGASVNPDYASSPTPILDDEDPGQFLLGTERLVTREGEAIVVATVARINGFGGAVGVSYQTQGSTAQAGADFVSTSGTLTWPDGDATPRTFTVPITDDAAVEVTEFFTLTLLNPTGLATLSPYSVTAVTLLDNDATGATINVMVTGDDLTNNGNCTLREAVRAANLNQAVDACPAGTGADLIVLGALTYTLSLAGTGEDDALTGDLDITEDLTLRGAGASATAIHGAQLDRVLDIAPSGQLVQLVLEDLTLRGGNAGNDNGGGARNLGALIVRDAAFRDNTADSGGGLWSQKYLLATSAVFENNQAADNGGGLFLDSGSTSALSGLQVISNTADSDGGGLHLRGSGVLSQSDFERNTTTGFGDGAGLITYDGQAVLTDVSLRENQASGDGGGLSLYGYWIIMTGGEVTLNTSDYGGGLYLEPFEAAVLADVTVTDNTATSEGGGIYAYDTSLLVTGSRIVGNESNEGGGVYLYDQRLWLAASAIQDNQAANAGGGLLAYETHVFARQASVTGNEAVDGGGLYSDSNSYTRLLNTTVAANTATSQGGGLTNDGLVRLTHASVAGNTAPLGAGLYNDPSNAIFLSVLNTLLAANTGGNCGGNALTSLGHNLSSDSTCGLSATGDLNNVAANLDTLALHNGPTLVQGLLSTSPAIDAADDSACPAVDQRGLPRPVDGDNDTLAACDIGAFEWQLVILKLFLPLISR